MSCRSIKEWCFRDGKLFVCFVEMLLEMRSWGLYNIPRDLPPRQVFACPRVFPLSGTGLVESRI